MIKAPHTTKSTKQIINELKSMESIDESTLDQATLLSLQLVTKEPLLQTSFLLGPSALRTYLKTVIAEEPNRKTTVHILLAQYYINDRARWIIEAYEDDIGCARELIHFVTPLKEKNKVPYLWVLLKHCSLELLNTPFKNKKQLYKLLNSSELMPFIKGIAAENTLKRFSGDTNTACTIYDFLLTQSYVDIDFKSINEAEYRADLGGGLATPYISSLLGQPYITHDINDPKELIKEVQAITPPKDLTLEEYVECLKVQDYKEHNVYDPEGYPKNYDKYSIVSFGFLTSTVRTTNPLNHVEHNYISTTYYGLKQILELVAMGKEVHCFFYGRPTVKVYDNMLIQMKFKDHKCISIETASRRDLKGDTRTSLYGLINSAHVLNEKFDSKFDTIEDL